MVENIEGTTPHRPSIIKLGTGKKAIPIFRIERTGNCYDIHHIPTLTLVGNLYYYLSLARGLCNEALDYDSTIWNNGDIDSIRKILPNHVKAYFEHYRCRDVKAPTSITEWTSSVEYEQLIRREHDRAIHAKQTREYAEELWEGDTSLAYVSVSDGGTIDADTLASVIRGRPTKV